MRLMCQASTISAGFIAKTLQQRCYNGIHHKRHETPQRGRESEACGINLCLVGWYKMRKILNKPITTDDLGNEVYQCQYSKKLVSIDKAIFLGALIPSVSGTYVCHEEGKEARKLSKRNFDENDANCNTCKNLQRVHHEKRKDGCLEGLCKIHAVRMKFHPDDWMGNECWEAR